MKKKLRILEISSAILFVIYIFTTYQYANGSILRIQAYSDLSLIPVFFWGAFLLIGIRIMKGDTGFIRIGIVLGLGLGCFVMIRQIVFNPYEFERIHVDNHDIIVLVETYPDDRYVVVYQKQNLLFSTFVGSVQVPLVYELSYELDGDTVIVYKCAEVSCVTNEINLE